MNSPYLCPYCNKNTFSKTSKKQQKFFTSWKDVRAHASTCLNNNRSYIFSLVYGPIKLDSLQNKNYMEIRELYPLLEPSISNYISRKVRKLGYTTNISWSFDSAKESILNFIANNNNRLPTSRDTYNNYELPSDHWVKEHYKTWNNFITLCGLKPNKLSGYGQCHKFIDGNTYRSTLEVYLVSNYLYNKFSYIYEKPYPGNTNRISDFYLPDYNIFIEVDGGLRPEVIKEKIDYCTNNNLKLLVLYPKQIYKKDFSLLSHINNIELLYNSETIK